MTKVLRTIGKITHINLQDPETEVMSDICDKRQKKAFRSRGLERALPICHDGSQYPPGCTVLECQFDRPVARIVQVPTDTAATARNACLLVKMKPSFDTFSRVAPRREDVKQRIDICSRTTDKFMLLPTSYNLKYDRTDDSVALAGKVKLPVKIASSAILEMDKKRLDDSSSRILRCSSSKNILRASYSDDKSPKEPVTFIECMTTPLTRVTRCSTKTKEGDKTNYCIHLKSKLKKDSSHKIIQPVIDSKRMILDQKARIFGERTLSERSVSCRKSKPVTHRTPPDCELACPGKADLKINILLFPEMKDSLSQITRKNGLDPSKILSSLKKSSRKYKRRICPASCCQPVRPVTKDVSSDFLHMKSLALDAKSPIEICTTQRRLDDQRLQRLASEKMLRTEVVRIQPKLDKASACQKSAFKCACLMPEKVSRDTSRLPSSQELLERYKKYIPVYQLEKYEACRSRRNGLQDECIPPLLRAILRKEEQQRTMDKCSKRKVDQLDQSGMSKSMNQTEFLFYFG